MIFLSLLHLFIIIFLLSYLLSLCLYLQCPNFATPQKISVYVIPYNPSHLPECYTLGNFSSSESQCYDLGHTRYTSSFFFIENFHVCECGAWMCTCLSCIYISVGKISLIFLSSPWEMFSMTAQYYIFNLVVHGTIYWENRYMVLITFFQFILSQIVFTN